MKLNWYSNCIFTLMERFTLILVYLLFPMMLFAQKEYHVFPIDHKITPGKPTGNGSLQNPWDLQTAFNQKNDVVNGGDIIWIHGGTYNGRYTSNVSSNIPNKYVTISSHKNDKVTLNGNVESKQGYVLLVKGKQTIYKDFEVTFLGPFERNVKAKNFEKVAGVYHTTGVNCRFINLRIHDTPGLGFGTWNSTAGTIIEYCMIYNNGFVDTDGKGGGEGMYVQNSSDTETRIIRNNIIFGNYYKAIEVWSANRDAHREYVKNITLENNVVFNSGLPSGFTVDNIILASDDRNGTNIAKNIKVLDNVLYHNTHFLKNEVNGNAPSLTLGYYKNSPVEKVQVDNNIIIGRNNALRLLYVKSLKFNNNKIYTGYIHINQLPLDDLKQLDFNHNIYYTKNSTPYLFQNKKYNLSNWKSKLAINETSEYKNTNAFDLNSVLDITQNEYHPNQYRVVLFSKKEEDVKVDFSKYNLSEGTIYSIKDVENYSEVLKSGVLGNDKTVVFPMELNQGNHNKTLDNFGVYIIEFSRIGEEKKSFLEKLFGWMF